jgi:hypothetical protein
MSYFKAIVACGVLISAALSSVLIHSEEAKSPQINIHADHSDTASIIQLTPNDVNMVQLPPVSHRSCW